MEGLAEPADSDAPPYDYVGAANAFMDWLERAGHGGIPTTMLPPNDATELGQARREAFDMAIQNGRTHELQTYHQRVQDFAFSTFRRYGLYPVYFTGHSASAERKVDAIGVLLDAMTAYLLADVLREETSGTLFARLDVMLGGHIFPAEAAPE